MAARRARGGGCVVSWAAAIIRGHWGIEDRLHWVRDTDFGEDRSPARTAAGPRVMASLRNLVITILRLAGAASIAAALRYHARLPATPNDHEVLNDFAARGWRVPRCFAPVTAG